MKKAIKLVAAVLAMLLLSGCVRTVDQMYRVPKRSDAYNNLQSAIDNAITGLEYCAPRAGENQQNVQMADLDGDGVQEYLLFAKSNQKRPLKILLFRNVDGIFTNTDTVEFNGTSFDQVEYVDMDGDGGLEIVVGRLLSDQVIRSVSVYTFTNDVLVQLATVNYTRFLTTDLDNDQLSELLVFRPGQTDTDNGIAELYSMKDGEMERYNEVSMSQPADKLKRIIIGKLDGGKTAVYTACIVGDTALVTDVFMLKDAMLTNVAFSNETGTAVQTLRNYYVYADDIDNDSVVELPYLITMKPIDGMVSAQTHQLIRWYAMTPEGGEVDKMYTYHNFVGGWYIQLQRQWAPRLVVKNAGPQYEFYIWDEDYKNVQKIMTLFVITTQNREEQAKTGGYVILHRTDSTVYAAAMESCASEYGLTAENITYSFRIIQNDWKTGET